MTTPTGTNPAGVRTFDHRKVAHLPEYERASRTIDELAEAMVAAKVDIAQADWLGLVRDMAAALCFLDRCPECLDALAAPYIASVEGDTLRGVYRCRRCAHTWTCSWATWAPLMHLSGSAEAGEEQQGGAA